MSDAGIFSTSGTGRGSDAGRPAGDVSRDILGIGIRALSRGEAIAEIETKIVRGNHGKYAFLNAHGANLAWQNGDFRRILAQFHVLADGVGVDIGSEILYGAKFPANLNGTDFVPALFSAIGQPLRVAMLGARAGVAVEAADRLRELYPRHLFDVLHHGYFSAAEEPELIAKLRREKPDILLVALGNPLQELWIGGNCSSETCTIAIGVGALFDFIAGSVPRAPAFMIRMRIEWLYRLWLEPRRMWRRYVLGNPLFLLRILRQKFGRLPDRLP